MIERAAVVAFDRRSFGKLWERDRGHLGPSEQKAFSLRVRRAADLLADRLPRERDVSDVQCRTVAWAVLALLGLPAQRDVGLLLPTRATCVRLSSLESVRDGFRGCAWPTWAGVGIEMPTNSADYSGGDDPEIGGGSWPR